MEQYQRLSGEEKPVSGWIADCDTARESKLLCLQLNPSPERAATLGESAPAVMERSMKHC